MQAQHHAAKSMVKAHFQVKLRRSEERSFTNNFNQIRNLIAKSTKQGEMVKVRSHALQNKKEVARDIKG